jgi:hypothetical protein
MASYSVHLSPDDSWGNGSVDVGSPAQPGQSRVRRLEKTHDRLITSPAEGINTVYDILQYASRTHGTRNAYGYRDVIDIIEEQKEVTKTVDGKQVKETKTWKYFHLSDYKYISYVDLKNIVSEVSRGLLKLGIQKNDVFNIYAQTRYVESFSPFLFPFLPTTTPISSPFSCFLSSFFIPCHHSLRTPNDGFPVFVREPVYGPDPSKRCIAALASPYQKPLVIVPGFADHSRVYAYLSLYPIAPHLSPSHFCKREGLKPLSQ